MATEACEGFLPWSQGPQLGSFARGETYAHDILQDLNHHAVGWTDWNALLDMKVRKANFDTICTTFDTSVFQYRR